MHRFRAGLAAVLLGSLAGCTIFDMQELRSVVPQGTAFQRELAANYLMFSEQEAEDYDWADSQRFAQKGLIAAYGHDVAPEVPDAWDIDPRHLPELRDARAALGAALTARAKETNPVMAARALFAYDCWVEQQEEGWQEEDIKACRDSFFESLDALNQAASSEDKISEPKSIQKLGRPDSNTGNADAKNEEKNKTALPSAPAMEVSPPKPGVRPMLDERAHNVAPDANGSPYVVFFRLGKATVDKKGLTIIEQAAAAIKNLDHYEVIVNGHTDASGNPDANLELALKRAENVKKELVKRGVNAEKINVFSFGESDQKTPTKDGRHEQSNRRVEIFISG